MNCRRCLRLLFVGLFLVGRSSMAAHPGPAAGAIAAGGRRFTEGDFQIKGKYDKTIAHRTRAIRCDPRVVVMYPIRLITYIWGCAHGKRGDSAKAIADYAKTLWLDRNFTRAYDALVGQLAPGVVMILARSGSNLHPLVATTAADERPPRQRARAVFSLLTPHSLHSMSEISARSSLFLAANAKTTHLNAHGWTQNLHPASYGHGRPLREGTHGNGHYSPIKWAADFPAYAFGRSFEAVFRTRPRTNQDENMAVSWPPAGLTRPLPQKNLAPTKEAGSGARIANLPDRCHFALPSLLMAIANIRARQIQSDSFASRTPMVHNSSAVRRADVGR